MNIAIRVDASKRIGVGHLARCQNLAERLAEKGCKVVFVSRDFGGEFLKQIKSPPFELITLPTPAKAEQDQADANPGSHGSWLSVAWQTDMQQTIDALSASRSWDWLVVDHYGIDCQWHMKLRSVVDRILVIDDLCDRRFDCDMFLNQSYLGDDTARYSPLLPDGSIQFLGPQFMLFGRGFHRPAKRKSKPIERVMVSFGGTDSSDMSSQVMDVLGKVLSDDIKVDLVIGKTYANAAELMTYGNRSNTTLHTSLSCLAPLMRRADIGIGSGGLTALERVAMGLPSVAIILSENQREPLLHLEQMGCVQLFNDQDELATLLTHLLERGTFTVPNVVTDGTEKVIAAMQSHRLRRSQI